MFFQAWSLVSCLHRLKLNPNTHFPPPLCPFECSHPSLTSNMPIRTQPFVVHLHCVDSSSVARPLPPSSQFEPERSFLPSTISIRAQSLVYPLRVHRVIRAQPLVSYPYHVNLSMATRVPPQPGPFEHDPSFPTHTMSIRSCPTFTMSS